jgi:hypothetical protein
MKIYYGVYRDEYCLFLSDNYATTQRELSRKIKEDSKLYTQPCHSDGSKITKDELKPILVIERNADKDYEKWLSIPTDKFDIKIVESEKDLIEPEKTNYYVINSSMQFCKKTKSLATVYFEKLKYNEYITELTLVGIPCLNSKFIIAKVIDIKRNWEYYFERLDTNCLFIRPIIDKKFSSLNYGKLGGPQQLDDYGVRGLAILAKSQKIKEEYRFFISNNKIITASMYKSNDDIVYSTSIPEKVNSLAETVALLNLNNLHKLVLDIAVSYDDVPSVLEINCWSSSGLYECDYLKIALETIGI